MNISLLLRRVSRCVSNSLLMVLLLVLTGAGYISCKNKKDTKEKKDSHKNKLTKLFSLKQTDKIRIEEVEKLSGDNCADLWMRAERIWDKGCKGKGERQLAVKLGRTVHCRCLKGEGECCFYFSRVFAVSQIFENEIMTNENRYELYKKYGRKGCELGYAPSCLSYLSTIGKLFPEKIARIWKEEKEFIQEIKRLCRDGQKFACIQFVLMCRDLYSVWKEKAKKEYALGLIHKYGIDLCSPGDMALCDHYTSTLDSINKDLYVAYDIYRHMCEELKNDAACSVQFQVARSMEDVRLTHEEGFDLRWKSVMYSDEAHEMVDGWLYECYEDQGKSVKDRKYKKFAEKCMKWEKRLEEFERKKTKPEKEKEEKKGCGFNVKEFLCREELIEPKEKRRVSPYFRIIKDHLEPSIPIPELDETSRTKTHPRPKSAGSAK